MYNYSDQIQQNPAAITKNPNITISLPAAVVGGALLVTYFLLITLFGYETMTGLRFINFILLIPVVIYSLKTYIDNVPKKSYLEAFRVSFLSFVGSYAVLALFMFIYLMVLDRDLLTYIQQNTARGLKVNAFGIAALLIGEGIIGAVIITFVALQYFKPKIKWVA